MIMPSVVPENHPTVFDVVDNIQWTFLKAFPNNEEMQKFRAQNQCLYKSQSATADDQRWYRFACVHQSLHNCQFMFLAIKNTNLGYHVYRHGEHNHQIITPQSKSKTQSYFYFDSIFLFLNSATIGPKPSAERRTNCRR
jgi:hypothetical protein